MLHIGSLNLQDMYRYYACILFSHCTGFKLPKTVQALSEAVLECGDISTLCFIASNILAFTATGRGDYGMSSWNAQTDLTPLLTQFKKVTFQISTKVFLSPLYTFATLEDDLCGTGASDSQVRSVSARKADQEGPAADVLRKAHFEITYMVHFCRRSGRKANCVASINDALDEGRVEQNLTGFPACEPSKVLLSFLCEHLSVANIRSD